CLPGLVHRATRSWSPLRAVGGRAKGDWPVPKAGSCSTERDRGGAGRLLSQKIGKNTGRVARRARDHEGAKNIGRVRAPMDMRQVRPHTAPVYAALDRYRELSLRLLHSSFLEESDSDYAKVWSPSSAAELVHLFIEQPDVSKRSFAEKIRDQ